MPSPFRPSWTFPSFLKSSSVLCTKSLHLKMPKSLDVLMKGRKEGREERTEKKAFDILNTFLFRKRSRDGLHPPAPQRAQTALWHLPGVQCAGVSRSRSKMSALFRGVYSDLLFLSFLEFLHCITVCISLSSHVFFTWHIYIYMGLSKSIRLGPRLLWGVAAFAGLGLQIGSRLHRWSAFGERSIASPDLSNCPTISLFIVTSLPKAT